MFEWDQEKNNQLIATRGVSFEAVVSRIEAGEILGIARGKGKFAHQKQFVVEINHYVYVIPFVEDEFKIFLKTIIPSRKMTKKFLGGKYEKE